MTRSKDSSIEQQILRCILLFYLCGVQRSLQVLHNINIVYQHIDGKYQFFAHKLTSILIKFVRLCNKSMAV